MFDVGIEIVLYFSILNAGLIIIGEGSWYEMPLVFLIQIVVKSDV